MQTKNESRKQILKSTSIVGGAQVFSIIIGIVRTKVIAVLIGPAGVGLLSMLQSIISLVQSTTGFGINFSGVREVAEASATENRRQIEKTITILRRWAVGTGLLGMLAAIVLCFPLSNFTFGTDKYALSIAIISPILLLTSISSSQIALLQGLRKIKIMAKSTIYGTILSTSVTLPLYWWLGINGIVPSMILIAFISLLVSWSYARKIKIESPILSFTNTLKEGVNMARLGFLFVVSGFVATATMYAIRALVLKKMDIDAVGCFQASWMISNMYMNIILNALLADYFPRLSAINKDNTAANKLINEQMEMTLLIGFPMIIFLIPLASIVLKVLYSAKFLMAISVLQWQLVGSYLVFISWPLGVMFMAKNKGLYNIIINAVWGVSYFLFTFFGWDYFGFDVLGIAYIVSALFNLVFTIFFARNLGNYYFSHINLRYILIFGVVLLIMMININYLNGYLQHIINSTLIILSIIFCYYELNKIINVLGLLRSKVLGI